eukprot:m.93029 g.93029  ORF g.93029 m.93029 type:complete len:116 (-) comp12096_c0_seq2:2067-2414(-)
MSESAERSADTLQVLKSLGLKTDGDAADLERRRHEPMMSDADEALRECKWQKVNYQGEKGFYAASKWNDVGGLRFFHGFAVLRRSKNEVWNDKLDYVEPTSVTLPCKGRVQCAIS